MDTLIEVAPVSAGVGSSPLLRRLGWFWSLYSTARFRLVPPDGPYVRAPDLRHPWWRVLLPAGSLNEH